MKRKALLGGRECSWCGEIAYQEVSATVNFYDEGDEWYCHWENSGPEGSCWEQWIVETTPEFEEWLTWGFDEFGNPEGEEEDDSDDFEGDC